MFERLSNSEVYLAKPRVHEPLNYIYFKVNSSRERCFVKGVVYLRISLEGRVMC